MLVFFFTKTDRVSANPLSGMSVSPIGTPRVGTDIPDRGLADTLSVFVKR